MPRPGTLTPRSQRQDGASGPGRQHQWNRGDGRVKVAVTRIHTGRVAELRVEPSDAMTAFHHPFAYHEATTRAARAERLHV